MKKLSRKAVKRLLKPRKLKKTLTRLRTVGIAQKHVRRIAKANKEARRIIGLDIHDQSPIFEPDNEISWVVYGGAGSGKSTCVAVPAIQCFLEDADCALVVNDVKSGEIAHQIAQMVLEAGRKFAVIDDSFVLGEGYPYRVTVNPFGNLVTAYKTNSPKLREEIETATLTLIPEPEGGLDKNFYFRQTPREFLMLAIQILLGRDPRFVTPGGLAALLADPEMWGTFVDIAAEEGDALVRNPARQIKEMREMDPEHYSQHYLAALSALRFFAAGSPLHQAGQYEDVTHEELLRENYVVCLVQSLTSASRLGPYYGLHFNSFLSAQYSEKCGRTQIILDEAANTPAKGLIEGVTGFRSAQLRVLYIAQSRSDLQRQYSEKTINTLEDNCNLHWLKLGNLEEAKRVSEAIGEIDNVNVNLSGSSDNPALQSTIQTGREPLYPIDRLLNLPRGLQISHVDGVGWVLSQKIRQNEIGPSCFFLDVNPQEGGRLKPDVKVMLNTPNQGSNS